MSLPTFGDIYKAGIHPDTHEIVLYPKRKHPPYPKTNECLQYWREGKGFVKGKREKHEFQKRIFYIYQCPYGHRWEGKRVRKS